MRFKPKTRVTAVSGMDNGHASAQALTGVTFKLLTTTGVFQNLNLIEQARNRIGRPGTLLRCI